MQILIVDDHAINRELLRAQLEPEGCRVFEAEDGIDALRLLTSESIDAVISDILMPRMDGYRLCLEMRRMEQFCHVPLVFLTNTYLAPDDEKLALDMGADKYLRKPAATLALIEALKEAVTAPARRRPITPLAEADVLTEYSERLVTKLEERSIALEQAQGELQRAYEDQSRLLARNEHLNRVYAVLSQINALIIRVQTRETLFKETCRIAVEAGAYRTAWIGVIDPETKDGKVIAWHGAEDAYLELVKFTAREGTPCSERPASRAVRYSQSVICNDIAGDPTVAAIRDNLLGMGNKAVGCFPLTVAGQPHGVFALFSSEVNAFDAEETRLLGELAGDISFALDHLEKLDRLNYLAFYDVLTGLANRGLFIERVAQHLSNAVSGGDKVAVGMFDLERFNKINHTFGRTAGDSLLRQVADWLTLRLGGATLLARVDADHFAAVFPRVLSESRLARVIEASLDALLQHLFPLNDREFRVAAKVGLALFPDDGADADTLLKNAEAALKKAKVQGDRFLFYGQGMTDTSIVGLGLEYHLREAIDKGEFVLHYQPKVNLVSGKLTGAEALLRWNDPRTGLVPPARFIPLLEETGLIREVGSWVLHQAIQDYLGWRAAGLAAVRIAVNVSPRQLGNQAFVHEVRQIIEIEKHAAAGLELEITESLIMQNVEHSIASLGAIRAMGVNVAIDDFGTGFSSLSQLSKLPVDTLKIDRSFVYDMTAQANGQVLISAIINLAHSLKLKVVAEGVETEKQLGLLRKLKCDEMQGYLFGKPVPREIFEATFLAPRLSGESLP
ncbi:MAG: two-component system response regulator [Steroidobacteraceae bacterium]